MWKPIGEYMIVEAWQNTIAGLVLPEDMKLGEGDIFKVISTGPGYYTDTGTLIPYDIKPGDKVMITGKILRIPGEKKLLLARQTDVLAIEREEIPDKI